MKGWNRIGSFLYDFRKSVIVVILLITLLLSYVGMGLPGILSSDAFKTEGDFDATEKLIKDNFDNANNTMILVMDKKEFATEDKFKAGIKGIMDAIKKDYPKGKLINPLENPGMYQSDIAYAAFSLPESTDQNEIQSLTAEYGETIQTYENDAVEVTPTGYAVLNKEMNERSQTDLMRAETIGIPIAFLVLLLAFGSVVTSIIPIIIGGLSVLSTMGVLYFIGQDTELSLYVLNVAPMVGFALSIDFALLFVNRFKEELIQMDNVKDALSKTYRTAGRSVLFSGLCVFIGLSGLLFFKMNVFESVAIGGMTVVLMSLLLSLTILPALLAILGKRVMKKSKLLSFKKKEGSGTVWRSFAGFVMKRPVLMSIIVLVMLITFIIPIKDVRLVIPTIDALPKSSETRLAYERFEKAFVDKVHANVTFVIETENSPKRDEASFKVVEGFIKDMEGYKGVDSVESMYQYVPQNIQRDQLFQVLQSEKGTMIQPAIDPYVKMDYSLVKVKLDAKPDSSESREWVKDFKKDYKISDGASLHIGGAAAFDEGIFSEIITKAPYALLMIMTSTFLILMIAFRSILIPLKAIIMNTLSLTATFGILVWIFQDGNLGMPETGIMLILPVLIFGLVFGMSMDYEVFLISRIHEIYEETKNNDYATLEGLTSTSKIITSAASIMIAVTAAFAFTDIMPIRQIGLGIAIAIFLDASIIRMIFVPSLMKLLGDWNWYFPFKKK